MHQVHTHFETHRFISIWRFLSDSSHLAQLYRSGQSGTRAEELHLTVQTSAHTRLLQQGSLETLPTPLLEQQSTDYK